MYIPKQLSKISKRINSGHRVNKIRVRDLLRMFGAERRGQNKVQEIRDALVTLNLETCPDFESIWIDGFIKIISSAPCAEMLDDDDNDDDDDDIDDDDNGCINEEIDQERGQDDEAEGMLTGDVSTGSVISNISVPERQVQPAIDIASDRVEETLTTKASDPTFRIGNLPAANAGVTTVSQDDLVSTAITKMLQFDFSQLPIMQGEREVKGVISWKSIASLGVSSRTIKTVWDCSDVAQVIDANGSLFDAVPTIARHGYVLVKDPQNKKITGIVTSSDLNLHFQQLTQPFLLLREIELHIRELLKSKITPDDLKIIESGPQAPVVISQISGLSFGHYIRLFQRPEIWNKLDLKIDQKSLVSQLDAVREIRNDVMHFSPDPISLEQRETLKNAAMFMQTIFKLFLA